MPNICRINDDFSPAPLGVIIVSKVAGIRGAISVEENTREDILSSTTRLLQEIVSRNKVIVEDIVSVIFTVTPDLNAAFPAEAARQMGWREVPLMDAVEIPVPGSLPKVIRVLVHVNVTEDFKSTHVFMGNAQKLRPDLSGIE